MTIPEQPRDLPAGWIPDDGFGERLNRVRRTLDLTLRDAAELCGLNYRTWQTWEDGRRPQDVLAIVEKISVTLGVDRDWLAWGQIDPTRDSPRLSREHEVPAQEGFSGSDVDQFLDAIEATQTTNAA